MLKKIKLIIALATFLTIAACAGKDYDWMSGGTYGGGSKLTAKIDDYSDQTVLIESGTGSFSFTSLAAFTMGEDTPLPGCNITANVSAENGKYQLTELDRAYKGQSQDLQGCLARVGNASTRVDIEKGWFTRDKNGETVLSLTFRKRGSPNDPLFEYELRARKTSWFW